jgi:hypothetical protein
MPRFLFALILAPALSGCVAGALVDVATAPVRVVSKGVDLATTSQSEADQKRGRELRKLEERYGKLERRYRKEDGRCAKGNLESCAKRDAVAAEMEEIRPQIPIRAD